MPNYYSQNQVLLKLKLPLKFCKSSITDFIPLELIQTGGRRLHVEIHECQLCEISENYHSGKNLFLTYVLNESEN
jgi:hypothetical protein